MKKKLFEGMRKNGFYAVSLFGVVTIIAAAAIAMSLTGSDGEEEGPLVDLNEAPGIVSEQSGKQDELAQGEPEATIGGNTGTSSALNNPELDKIIQGIEEIKSGKQTEDVKDAGELTDRSGMPDTGTYKEQAAQSEQTEQAAVASGEQTQEVPVMSTEAMIAALSFQTEQGIAWPIAGNVILNYSPEHAIYHSTLDSYRTTNAILIGGEEGMPVCAAAKGVITEIKEELKTGMTVTMRISEEYSVRYGQVGEVKAKVGDVVQEGEAFAVLAAPTKYYTVEGACLYFQLLKEDAPVNPMLYLRDSGEEAE